MQACIIYKFHFDPITRPLTYFDLGAGEAYFDRNLTKKYFVRDFKKNALPIFEQLNSTKKARISCYFSGVFLELLLEQPAYLTMVKDLVSRGQIELLGGTYYHTLSSLISASLFKMEAQKHTQMLLNLFDTEPVGFFNTANIYANDLVNLLSSLETKALLVPKIPWFQGDNVTDSVFQSVNKDITLVLVGDRYQAGEGQKYPRVYGLNGMSYNAVNILYDTNISQTGFTDIIKDSNKLTYSLPDTVALDFNGDDLSHLIGNALQKEYLRRLKELSLSVNNNTDVNLIELILQLAGEKEFRSISRFKHETDRYRNYRQLMNYLADLELRLGK